LVHVLSSGWAIFRGKRSYRDLPVFDTVRQHERRTDGVNSRSIEIFALCPFKSDYLKHDWPRLRTLIMGLETGDERSFDVRQVTDYLSPLLMGERLYELARFADRCIVDWTYWRGNVFFELGVRLAVNPVSPICIVRSGHKKSLSGQAELLSTFAPIRYDLDDPSSDEAHAFGAEFLKVELDNHGRRERPNQVYAAAERNMALDQESGHEPLERELMRQVSAVIPDFGRAGGFKFLYHGNLALSQQVWRNLVDRLEAANLLLKYKTGRAKARQGPQLDELQSRVTLMLKEWQEFGRERGYDTDGEVADDDRQ
jgi:hypothetical protein